MTYEEKKKQKKTIIAIHKSLLSEITIDKHLDYLRLRDCKNSDCLSLRLQKKKKKYHQSIIYIRNRDNCDYFLCFVTS